LSIEKFLMKSEEAFFGKVRKDKLSGAASIRSSQRESVWGTPAPSLYSRPSCKLNHAAGQQRLTFIAAPNNQRFSISDYEGPMQNDHQDAGLPEVVPMTRLQIAMAREIGGWPIYTIIIGLGQVCSLLF
jgi:alpha-1,3-glucan synthase